MALYSLCKIMVLCALSQAAAADPSFEVLSGSCTVKGDGCVYSDNFGPGQKYSNTQNCVIKQNEPFPLDVRSFDVEEGVHPHMVPSSWPGLESGPAGSFLTPAGTPGSLLNPECFDFLEVNGVKFCGKIGPQGVTPAAGSQLVWRTDENMITHAGFKICALRKRVRTQVHLRITTGTFDANDGTLDVEVDDGSGYASVTKGVFWGRGDVVLDASYPTLSGVRVRSPTNNGWIGAIEYSSDGGVTYVSFLCTDCTAGSDTARIAVDGNSTPRRGVATCLGGATCTLRTSTHVHLRITTGTSTYDEGTLDVEVDDGSGYASVTKKGAYWRKGVVVLDASYSTLLGVRVHNPTTNAWIGAIEYSDRLVWAHDSSDGGAIYVPFVCTDCTEGSSTARIAVDGNSDAAGLAPTTCLGSATCTLWPHSG